MKNSLWILMLGIVLMSLNLYAEGIGNTESNNNCGGEVFVANNHSYCRSLGEMNWYTAMAWCQAQGRHLVSVYEALNIDPNGPVSKDWAPAIAGGYYTWTSSNASASTVYIFESSGKPNPSVKVGASYTNKRAVCW